ncbi:MAG TPA: hypothetical protein PKA63_07675 [Oligoflexia bacterium]|nr:hypothetical protein [Oligoflexia bacterium]HMP48528.1 hypothetical protein [Oligoflexia bacterium]
MKVVCHLIRHDEVVFGFEDGGREINLTASISKNSENASSHHLLLSLPDQISVSENEIKAAYLDRLRANVHVTVSIGRAGTGSLNCVKDEARLALDQFYLGRECSDCSGS